MMLVRLQTLWKRRRNFRVFLGLTVTIPSGSVPETPVSPLISRDQPWESSPALLRVHRHFEVYASSQEEAQEIALKSVRWALTTEGYEVDRFSVQQAGST